MSRGCFITAASYRAAIRLLGELGEMQTASAEQLRRHLMERLAILFGCPVWWSILEGDPGPQTEAPSLQVIHSDIFGLVDWQQHHWQQTFIEGGTYFSHPMWNGLNHQAGCARTLRREQLVDDRSWYRSPFVAEFQRHLGFDDVMASAIPLGGGREVLLALSRPWGDRSFEERDVLLLTLIQKATLWIQCRQLHDLQKEKAAAVLDEPARQLPPRHRRVLDLLLLGRSEKEIAHQTGLTARTTHKYIEQIYRAFQVSSRAELMALWIK
jgi:DNA-binding CsgD family transcriptional regulator